MKHLQSFDEFINEASNYKQTLTVLKMNDPNNDDMYAAIEVYLNAKPNKIFYTEEQSPKFDDFNFHSMKPRLFAKDTLELVYDKHDNVVAVSPTTSKAISGSTFFYTK